MSKRRLTKAEREMIPVLTKNGYHFNRMGGRESHAIYKHEVTNDEVAVPIKLRKMTKLRVTRHVKAVGARFN